MFNDDWLTTNMLDAYADEVLILFGLAGFLRDLLPPTREYFLVLLEKLFRVHTFMLTNERRFSLSCVFHFKSHAEEHPGNERPDVPVPRDNPFGQLLVNQERQLLGSRIRSPNVHGPVRGQVCPLHE
jgi:hypothetical protein